MSIQKLTKEFLLSRIADTRYVHHEGTTLTHCLLTMKNGIVVDGKSACLNPADFDTEMGRKIAYDNAFAKLWELEGYARASEHAKEHAIVVTIKPGTPAFDTEALVSAIRTGGHVVVPEGVHVELLKEGQAKFSPEVRIVTCLDASSGTADFLRNAVKRKPALDLSAVAGTDGGAA